ncbi:hypothetical protein PHYC_01235 [Phycisphaerales bacterium]|nr:hypothetical protein PHYC_01235 [Phycisphaerales bacterium]
MSQASPNKVLSVMLERLFAAISSGPSLNCRPHNSRQRVDWTALEQLQDVAPGAALRDVLSEKAETRVVGRVKPVATARAGEEQDTSPEAVELRRRRKAFAAQQQLLSKLRVVVEEARTYENDTGVYVLNVGFPLLSLPPAFSGSRGFSSKRVLAPLAFVPVSVTVGGGASPTVEIACKSDEVDRVAPNEALLAWLEQQTGKVRGELFADEDGVAPWKEIAGIVRHVAKVLEIGVPELFQGDELPERLELIAAPKAEDAGEQPMILASAVVGLFPASNQGLIRDTKEMVEQGPPEGPVKRFVTAGGGALEQRATEDARPAEAAAPQGMAIGHRFRAQRLVTRADPCQARAVALARTENALVIHGPPGTGKSQTITNIIGDYLARGERVLFVCDKRTALDVVASRLQALGLGDLCALIHDPQRDQKDLYMSIRAQLEGLADATAKGGVEERLERADAELTQIHAELSGFRAMLTDAAEGATLHDLVGRWLALSAESEACPVRVEALRGGEASCVESSQTDLREALSRGVEVEYGENPWRNAAGIGLGAYLSRAGEDVRGGLDSLVAASAESDATIDPNIPAFVPGVALAEQSAARMSLADQLERVMRSPESEARRYWSGRSREEVASARRQLAEAGPALAAAREGTLDAELLMSMAGKPVLVSQLAQAIGALEQYLASAKSVMGFLAFGRKKAAGAVLAGFGLPLTADAAERTRRFLAQVRALAVVRAVLDGLRGRGMASDMPRCEAVLADADATEAVTAILSRVHTEPALGGIAERLTQALGAEGADGALVAGLRASHARAMALEKLENAAAATGLFSPAWMAKASGVWRGGTGAGPICESLRARLGTLEGVLRIRETLAKLTPAVRGGVEQMLAKGVDDELGLAALQQASAAGIIAARLEANPKLHATDAKRVQTLFARYRELEHLKAGLVREAILANWLAKQKARLLAATGTRLNGDGAKVRQRLVTRGAKAMRLRQVLALGRNEADGDPLLDLRPVWMASPETVAQIFPRQAVFDVVVFDEASQLRLEDAVPVLTRAARVVIAGDPKQLPPTRFFESAAAASEEEEIVTDEQLFEAQQTNVEDLLGAALNLDLHESYLDVHYRSRNADLIEFSNEHFYGSRLQAIPGHPKNRTRVPPLNLCRADGVYEDRTNEIEAEHVVRIVRDLLKRADPPSIGIACFNLSQRDLIVEKLDEAAEGDGEFARRLAQARSRMGSGAPEGLFVKNLENVQGDERDHIISTTYGPTKDGKFHRRFGPLLQPGGGRRLNVLVTRARDEIHLVTSIPREAYLSLPEVPAGATPGGGWLLMSYLQFAERLQGEYAEGAQNADEITKVAAVPAVPVVQPNAAPSPVAEALGGELAARHRTGSFVHWGNNGFCVDVALRNPRHPLDVTCGVLCDFARYTTGDDPIAWDIFRTGVLEGQGWKFERVWSPALFRDLQGCVEQILTTAERVAKEEEPEGLRVVKG